jgi:hypothetical protein
LLQIERGRERERAVIENQSAKMTTEKLKREKLTETMQKIAYHSLQPLTTSLEDGTSSEDLCLE